MKKRVAGVILALGMMALAGRAQEYSVVIGGGFYPHSQPAMTGNVSLAACTAASGGQAASAMPARSAPELCSYSTIEMRGVTETQPQYSVRTGIAKLLQGGRRFSLYALATGGVANSAEATSGAFSGGVLAGLRLGFADLILSGQGFSAPVAGGWQPLITVGFRFSPGGG